MDCFHTLSEEEEHLEPLYIKEFLEAMPDTEDSDGNVVNKGHGAAICQPLEDWSKEHIAMEQACEKLGPGCSYDIRKMISDVNRKVENLQEKSK